MTVAGTWTYSGNPSASDLDALRFTLGDTDSGSQQASDEELLYLINAYGSIRNAAIAACDALSAKAVQGGIDKKVGDLHISGSQLSGNYQNLRARLVRNAALTATPKAGGISVADKTANVENSDNTSPSFYRGQFDQPSNPEDGGRATDDNQNLYY